MYTHVYKAEMYMVTVCDVSCPTAINLPHSLCWMRLMLLLTTQTSIGYASHRKSTSVCVCVGVGVGVRACAWVCVCVRVRVCNSVSFVTSIGRVCVYIEHKVL